MLNQVCRTPSNPIRENKDVKQKEEGEEKKNSRDIIHKMTPQDMEVFCCTSIQTRGGQNDKRKITIFEEISTIHDMYHYRKVC